MSVNFEEYISRIKNDSDIFNKALLLQHLSKEKGYKVKTLAKYLELSPSYVCNLQRILKLPELIRDGYYTKLVTPTHLFVLSRLKSKEDMIQVYEKTLSKNLSTTELESEVRKILHGINTEGDHAKIDVIEKIVSRFGLDETISVKVVQTRLKAKLIIEKRGNLNETTEFLKELGSLDE